MLVYVRTYTLSSDVHMHAVYVCMYTLSSDFHMHTSVCGHVHAVLGLPHAC